MNILLLGIGNSLRGDDAAGLAIVRRWQEKYPSTANKVRVEFAEDVGLELLDLLENIQVGIFVDAIHSSAPAGTLFRFELDKVDPLMGRKQSSHGWGVTEILDLGKRLYPQFTSVRFIVIGIAGQQFGQGTMITPNVSSALDAGVDMVEKEICPLLST